jgi:DNA-binding protein H-NS
VRSIINSFGKLSFEHQAVALDQLKAHHAQSRSEKIAELKQHLAELGQKARTVGRPQAKTKVGSSALKRANGLSKRRGKRSVVKPKYRDAKTGDTWSGRGRMASWLKTKQKAGEKIEKYLVA